MINIAFVGCGRVSEHYIKIFKKINSEKYFIKVCFDLELIKAKDFALNFQDCKSDIDINNISNYSKIDLVIIATPSGNHYEHAKFFLKLGYNVLVEKPICMIPSQAGEIISLAEKKGIMLCCAFQNRFNKSIKYLKKIVDKKLLGKIITVSVRLRWCRLQSYYEDAWHGKWNMDGGVINQQAIHHIDILNWLFGPIDEVVSTSTKRLNNLEAEDTLIALFKLRNGGLGTIEATTAARPKDFEASISVIAENGKISISGIALNIIDDIYIINNKDKIDVNEFNEEVENGYGNSHFVLLNEIFIRLEDNNFESPVNPHEAMSTLKLIHSLYSSDETGSWIKNTKNIESKRLGLDNYN